MTSRKTVGLAASVFLLLAGCSKEGWEGKEVNGSREGPWTCWHKGRVAMEGNYLGDKPDGDWVFYVDGRILLRTAYRAGKLHGRVRMYDNSGKLESETEYRDGVQHGMCRYYDAGRVVSESSYVSGKGHGLSQLILTGGLNYTNPIIVRNRSFERTWSRQILLIRLTWL